MCARLLQISKKVNMIFYNSAALIYIYYELIFLSASNLEIILFPDTLN